MLVTELKQDGDLLYRRWAASAHGLRLRRHGIKSKKLIIRGYYTAVFISTRISRSSVDYQPEAIAEG